LPISTKLNSLDGSEGLDKSGEELQEEIKRMKQQKNNRVIVFILNIREFLLTEYSHYIPVVDWLLKIYNLN